MSLPRVSARRPVAVAMLFLAVVLLGGISFARLPIDLLPDVSYPRLVVYTSYPDVAPAEVERLVTERVEAEAAAVPGVERVSSVSREGMSLVTLRFAWGTDMDFAMLNVRERLDNLRDALPESATRPRILRVDPESEPMMTLSVAGPGGLWEAKELAETVIRRRLEQLDGVAQAVVTGGLDREIHVEVEPSRLQAYGLTLEDVATALDRANVSAPGGTILQGRYRYPLRTLGEFTTVDEMERVVLEPSRSRPDSAAANVVRLSDVGRVEDGFAEREALARMDGVEAVGLLVFKESGANTVAVDERVGEVLAQLAAEYPSVTVEVASSQAGFIGESIANVVQALVLGGLLAFIILFVFLRDPRYPVAVAAAIPISVVGAFALMDAAGVSLNIMSLGGLALGVGMLVDNSIVVVENIFRHREQGRSAEEAAARGAEEVQGAITASTLTTIAVFAPIIYVAGVAGELFGDLSLAVMFSLLASLLVALTLLPALAARFAREPTPPRIPATAPAGAGAQGSRVARWGRAALRAPGRAWRGSRALARDLGAFWWEGVAGASRRAFGPPLRAFDRAYDRFADRYHRALAWALDHRASVLGLSVAALAGTAALGLALPRDMLPAVDQGAFQVRLQLPEGSGLESTASAAAALEDALLEDPGVQAVFSRIGRDVRSFGEGEQASGLHTATLDVRVAQGHAAADVVGRFRSDAPRLPGAEVVVETGGSTALGQVLGASEADVAVRVRAEDLDAVHARAETVADRLRGLDRLTNVRLGAERGAPQLHVEILRERAAAYGISGLEVADAVDRAVRGARATEFADFDRKIAVVVRFPEDLRRSLAALDAMRVRGVPLRELVRVEEARAPSEVHREDQGRLVTVYADVARGGLGEAVEGVRAALADLPPSRDLRMEVGGENEEMRRSFRDLAFAFGLALVLVYMILAAQFESFAHPLTILTAVPLAMVGAVGALALAGQGLNTMSLIGCVILLGIVVNDAIVKVDFIRQAREAGLPLREAILEAGRVRLRPILMTTVTTVLGLTPMALGFGTGADLRAPLAIAVIGGLAVATLLTLVVVPVVYAVVDGARPERARAPAVAASSAAPMAASAD